jgi:hypothetical protein
MRRIEWPVRTISRQSADCGAQKWPLTTLCLYILRFWSFLELKRRGEALGYSKAKDGLGVCVWIAFTGACAIGPVFGPVRLVLIYLNSIIFTIATKPQTVVFKETLNLIASNVESLLMKKMLLKFCPCDYP